ncbi:MAG: hypothetical protein GYA51_10235 [Candidatus Methanofastidiosa archaeon]|nr:hypothetical protein [Candidatus Methanofastidiosa archaeon]
METIEKINVSVLKNDIKNLVEEQKNFKRLIKEANCIVKDGKVYWDPMHPSMTQSKAYWNGKKLRLMYAAYGLMRGKKFSQTENHYPEENHPLIQYIDQISKIIETYSKTEK